MFEIGNLYDETYGTDIINNFIFFSCNSHKEGKKEMRILHRKDSTYIKKIVYSKDSSFFKVTVQQIGELSDAPYDIYTIYMKYRGKYYEVHEKAGGDFLFIYTDSTKSKYIYDKNGKYFLKREERSKYFHLLSGK